MRGEAERPVVFRTRAVQSAFPGGCLSWDVVIQDYRQGAHVTNRGGHQRPRSPHLVPERSRRVCSECPRAAPPALSHRPAGESPPRAVRWDRRVRAGTRAPGGCSPPRPCPGSGPLRGETSPCPFNVPESQRGEGCSLCLGAPVLRSSPGGRMSHGAAGCAGAVARFSGRICEVVRRLTVVQRAERGCLGTQKGLVTAGEPGGRVAGRGRDPVWPRGHVTWLPAPAFPVPRRGRTGSSIARSRDSVMVMAVLWWTRKVCTMSHKIIELLYVKDLLENINTMCGRRIVSSLMFNHPPLLLPPPLRLQWMMSGGLSREPGTK